MTARLQRLLKSESTELEALLSQFFDTDDQNFKQRYQEFYAELAPLLELYRLRVGDTLAIKAFSRSGYVQSVNVKVYGTYNFQGLEKSPLAGGLSLMDLMSFRDLYGFLTTDKAEELKELQANSGARAISRESAEDELFGGGKEVVAEATPGIIDEQQQFSGDAKRLRNEDLTRRVYTEQELSGGVVLHAAVILKDEKFTTQVLKDIERLSEAEKLNIKAMSWQKAAGLLGQFLNVAKGSLYAVVLIIFVIAMIIINNAMMMATLQRTQTIGTMRAIGAQRSFVLTMVLVETVVLGLAFGGAGMLVGTAFMGWLGERGIAAWNDYSYFFFSGPKLLPVLTTGNLIAALVIILIVSSISTLIPAILATRVSPLRAMQSDE
jgi:ABC-type antimicrobial peptide transport system permease subunit